MTDARPPLTVSEICDTFRVGRTYVYERCRLLEWPHHRIGGRVMFTSDDVRKIEQITSVSPVPVRSRRRQSA